jgi:hypothetical protein
MAYPDFEAPRTQTTASEPTKDLIGEFFAQGQTLIRAELKLAKAELREEGKRAGVAGGMFAAAAGMALVAALTLTTFAILLLATFLPAWFAALLVTIGLGAGAVIVAKAAKKKWDLVRGPEQTLNALKEDSEWARQTMTAAKSQLRARA